MNRLGITLSTALLEKCAGLVYFTVFRFCLRRAKFFFQFSDSLLIDLLFLDLYRMDSGPALDGALSCFFPASFWLWCWPLSTGRRILIRVRLSRGKSVLMGKKTKQKKCLAGKSPHSLIPEKEHLFLFSSFFFLRFFILRLFKAISWLDIFLLSDAYQREKKHSSLFEEKERE